MMKPYENFCQYKIVSFLRHTYSVTDHITPLIGTTSIAYIKAPQNSPTLQQFIVVRTFVDSERNWQETRLNFQQNCLSLLFGIYCLWVYFYAQLVTVCVCIRIVLVSVWRVVSSCWSICLSFTIATLFSLKYFSHIHIYIHTHKAIPLGRTTVALFMHEIIAFIKI